MTRTAGLLFLMIFSHFSAEAAEPPIPPTTIDWTNVDSNLPVLLESISKQSGVSIDHSSISKGAKWTRKIERMPLWDVLQAVADQEQCRVELSASGDRIRFVPRGKAPAPMVSVSGPFRLTLKTVTSKYDFDSDQNLYEWGIDLCWEPRIRVFRVSQLKTTATAKGTVTPQPFDDPTKVNVTGSHHRLNARMLNIPRTVTQLETLNGSITVTAAAKMLRVGFDDLSTTPARKTVERVGVALTKWEKQDDLWEARIELTYPAGMPEFESFESECWLRDNLCRLVSPDRTKSFESKDFQVRIVPGGAVIDYRFAEDKAKGLLPARGWMLEVETPAPLVEFPVEFQFKSVRLP
ncbi:MAG: hypothetical protein U0798_10095 [Gemmataceae bacterium]